MYHLTLFDKLPKDKFELGIFQTFSIFNICNMEDLTKYLSNYFDHLRIHYNMVFTPDHISPKVLPKRVKEKVTALYGENPAEHVIRTLKFMNGEQYEKSEWINFILQTKQIDKFRKEQFENVFPELYKIIEKDWNGVQ